MRGEYQRLRGQEGPVQSFLSFLRGAFRTQARTPASSGSGLHQTNARAPVLPPIPKVELGEVVPVQSQMPVAVATATARTTPARVATPAAVAIAATIATTATTPTTATTATAPPPTTAGPSTPAPSTMQSPDTHVVNTRPRVAYTRDPQFEEELAALSLNGLQKFRNRGVLPLPEYLYNMDIPLLPTEIINQIFLHLWETRNTDIDIQNFRLACNLFNEVATKHVYRDLHLQLNEDETDPWERLIQEKHTGLKYTTTLSITGFPKFPVNGRYLRTKRAKYGQKEREVSRAALKALLEALEPGQLQSFSLRGRYMVKRIPKLDTKLLFDKQPNLRQLCIPLPMLLRIGDNINDVLRIVPRFEALYLTDVKYMRHIADIWALLKTSADSLTSLAIRSPNLGGWWGVNELERYLRWDRNFFSGRVGLPRTDLHLPKLRDLYIEGFPNLDRFINDCAPYLIPWSTLRMLRIERCYYVEAFLLLYCNVHRMPNLKSFQLVDEFESTTFDEIIKQLVPLETLMVCSNRWGSRPTWGLIKTYHGKSLKRLWLQDRYSSPSLPGLFDMRTKKHPYEDCFFPTGWPLLEEAAIELSDAQWTVLPETVKVCRLIGSVTAGLSDRYYWDAKNIMNKVAKFGVPKDQGSNLVLAAVGTHDPTDFGGVVRQPHYFAVERRDISCPGEKPKAQVIEIRDVKTVMPECHIMWFERNDRPWSDGNGSLWY
ncbi:hypothetical protein TWF694_005389 [Orbilia ellipsospora]|uniref:F-box domain-containing protein n=1 Tax=Orbilia ellipsospora TaxID=2528407 RepID=A0AAV9WT96_9PEZI